MRALLPHCCTKLFVSTCSSCLHLSGFHFLSWVESTGLLASTFSGISTLSQSDVAGPAASTSFFRERIPWQGCAFVRARAWRSHHPEPAFTHIRCTCLLGTTCHVTMPRCAQHAHVACTSHPGMLHSYRMHMLQARTTPMTLNQVAGPQYNVYRYCTAPKVQPQATPASLD